MPDLKIPPLLVDWFAQDPLLCFGVVAFICAAVYGLFNLDSQGDGGFDLFLDGGD